MNKAKGKRLKAKGKPVRWWGVKVVVSYYEMVKAVDGSRAIALAHRKLKVARAGAPLRVESKAREIIKGRAES